MPYSAQFMALKPIIDSLDDARFYVSNDSDSVFIKGDIAQIINLHKQMAPLGYRQKGGIQFFPNAKYTYAEPNGRIKRGFRDEGSIEFISEELRPKVFQPRD